MWGPQEIAMITKDGNVRHKANSSIVDEFDIYDCADLTFPHGTRQGNRVFHQISPYITLNGVFKLVVKVPRHP